MANVCPGLLHRYGHCRHALVSDCILLHLCPASVRLLGQLGCVEGESAFKPFCRPHFGRYSVYHAGGHRAETKLDVQENTGACHLRRPGYHPADDSAADYDDRSEVAAAGHCRDCDAVALLRVETDGALRLAAGLESHPLLFGTGVCRHAGHLCTEQALLW